MTPTDFPSIPKDANPEELLRQAVEELGVSPTDTLCQDISRLALYPIDSVYRRVIRHLQSLRQAKASMRCVGDRIPPPDVLTGEILFAVAPTPSGVLSPVRFGHDRPPLHTVLAGTPGSGKTYACRRLLKLIEMLHPEVRVLILDPNRSYERLCSDPSRWVSISWPDLRINPLNPPPGYPRELWQSEWLDSFARGELMHSRYLIAQRLDTLWKLAESKALATGNPIVPPSLFDLRDNLVACRCAPGSKLELYRQSALNVIDGRLRTSGYLYNCARGMEALITSTRCRISIEGLAPVESVEFLFNSLIHYVKCQRSMEPLIDPPILHTLLVLEEAQTVLQKRGDAIPYYEESLLRSRSMGIGFVFVAQDVSRIDPTVVAACSNVFVFAQTSAENKRTCKDMLDLSERETGLLGSLGVGECFVRLTGYPKWPHPFVARIPND